IIDFALGELLFSIGQTSRAIPFYERERKEEMEVNQVSVTERLAESHASIGSYETALQYYEQLDSEDPDTLFKYGFTTFQRKRYDIGSHMWRKLTENNPDQQTG